MRVGRALLTSLLLCAIVAMVACVPSLNPLYTDADLVFDEALLGSWTDEDEAGWQFEKSTGKSYVLTYQEKGTDSQPSSEAVRSARFAAHLVRLGDDLFLDLYPDSYPKGFDLGNDLLAFHLVPAHSFSRIWIDEDAIRIGMLDPEWLEKALTGGEIDIEHKRGDEGILLTATTSELQKFARSIADNTEAFAIDVELSRIEPPTS